MIIERENTQIFTIPLIAPLMIIMGRIHPQGVRQPRPLERKVVCIKGADLRDEVAGFIGFAVVHVVGDADFGEEARGGPDVVEAFLLYGEELVPEAVADGGLADAEGEAGEEVAATEDAEDVDVPDAVPGES